MFYIAYGSNMNPAQMAYRCPRSRMVGTGKLFGWKLKFNVHADIIHTDREADVTPVVVWEIAPGDWSRLDLYEGYPRYYVKEEIETRLDDGSVERCIAYVMAPGRAGYAPPDEGYFNIIEEGYRENGIDPRSLFEALEDMKTEEFLWQTCGAFHPDQPFGSYCEDIRRYLMCCGWHYSSEAAMETIERNMKRIEQSYNDREPVSDVAVDIGYCCG